MDIFEDCEYSSDEEEVVCSHQTIQKVPKAGIEICMDCGRTTELIIYDAEWRNYGNSEDKDMTRCHARDKKKDRGVKDFLEAHPNIYLNESIIGLVSLKTNQVIDFHFGVDAVRGSGRIGIIAASIIFSCRENGYPVTRTDVCRWLRINKREVSTGITRYLSAFPEHRVQHIAPRDLIKGILQDSGIIDEISPDVVEDILRFSDWLDGTSRKLSASTPKTVAAAIVYYYMCKKHPSVLTELGIFKKKPFAYKVGLSEVTINTHNEEIHHVVDKSKKKT